MGGPSSPHNTMREAFVLRLRQLYPDPAVKYQEEKEYCIVNVVRKPDVLIIHPNGNRWVYEMVHGNSHPAHLAENHALYAEAGIQDHWVLWETLQPFTKAKPVPNNQHVLSNIGWERKKYKLSAPHRAILSMQSGQLRYIYTFTSNYLKGEESFETAYGQLQMIGLVTYIFEGWSGEKEYVGESRFCPMADLQFDQNGSPIRPEKGVPDIIIERTMELTGIDPETDRYVGEINQVVGSIARSTEMMAKLQACFIQAALEQLSPDEQQELANYFQSKPEAEPVFQSGFKIEDISQLLNRPEIMNLAGVETQQILSIVEHLPIPEPLKKMLRWMLDAKKLISNAAFLKWQEESEALRRSR